MGGRKGIERKGQKHRGPAVELVPHKPKAEFKQPGSWWCVPREAWSQAIQGRMEQASWGPHADKQLTLAENVLRTPSRPTETFAPRPKRIDSE